MKKFKISLVAIFAIVIAIAGSAFTANHKTTETIYHYISSSNQLADMQVIDNWVAEEPGCGTSGNIPCAVPFDGDRNQFETYLAGFTSVAALNNVASENKF